MDAVQVMSAKLSRDTLYQLMIDQLARDGFTDAAAAVARSTGAPPYIPDYSASSLQDLVDRAWMASAGVPDVLTTPEYGVLKELSSGRWQDDVQSIATFRKYHPQLHERFISRFRKPVRTVAFSPDGGVFCSWLARSHSEAIFVAPRACLPGVAGCRW